MNKSELKNGSNKDILDKLNDSFLKENKIILFSKNINRYKR